MGEKAKPAARDVPLAKHLSLALTRLRKLEADIDNIKSLHLQLQARVLRLELELSLLSGPEPEMRVPGSLA